jgi:nitrogen regulatory protein PII-like uncharacterized protein
MVEHDVQAGGDRRGMDPSVLAFIQARQDAFESAHKEIHDQAEQARKDRGIMQKEMMAERDQRYAERFEASQEALREASKASRDAIEAALKAAKEAVDKSEVSQTKQADATFVKVENLGKALSDVMPRVEAVNRFNEMVKSIDELKLEVRTLAAEKAGKTEFTSGLVPWIAAAISLIIAVVVVANAVTG